MPLLKNSQRATKSQLHRRNKSVAARSKVLFALYKKQMSKVSFSSLVRLLHHGVVVDLKIPQEACQDLVLRQGFRSTILMKRENLPLVLALHQSTLLYTQSGGEKLRKLMQDTTVTVDISQKDFDQLT